MNAAKTKFIAVISGFFLSAVYILPQTHPAVEEKRMFNLIEKNFKEKKYEESLEILEKNRNKYPYSINFSYWYAMNLMYKKSSSIEERNQNYAKAASELEEIIPYIKSSPRMRKRRKIVYFHAGMAFGMTGNYKRAAAYMKRTIKEEERFAEAWYNLAVYYEKLHNVVESKRAFQKYLEIVNSDEEIF